MFHLLSTLDAAAISGREGHRFQWLFLDQEASKKPQNSAALFEEKGRKTRKFLHFRLPAAPDLLRTTKAFGKDAIFGAANLSNPLSPPRRPLTLATGLLRRKEN